MPTPANWQDWADRRVPLTGLGNLTANGHPVVPEKQHRRMPAGGTVLLLAASVLLAGLAAAMGIVSWHAQVTFIYAIKHQHLASALESLGLDDAEVIFALLGVALATLHRRAVFPRVMVCVCALGSAGMNVLGADLGSPRSVVVYVMPPLLFAVGADQLIAVIRRAALGAAESADSGSGWRIAGKACLYLLRVPADPWGTLTGARQALLNATPLPEIPQKRAAEVAAVPAPAVLKALPGPRPASGRAVSGGSKQARFLDLVEKAHGPLAEILLDRVGQLSKEFAPQVDLNEGAARTALRTAVLSAKNNNSTEAER